MKIRGALFLLMLIDKLKSDLKKATLNKDSTRVGTIRLLLASIHNKEIELRGQKKKLNEEDVLGVLQGQTKQRKESIEEFKKGGRADLVANEESELKIIKEYLPEQMSGDEIKKIVEKAIDETGASGVQDMGKVMGKVMVQLRGKADGGMVSKVVRECLINKGV